MTQDAQHRFDASAADLAHRCRDDFEAGAWVAEEEIRGLCSLAEAIGRGLSEWRDLAAPLALCRPLDTRRAGEIVIETVFDEVMEPEAWRVLADAFALVEHGPAPG